MFRFVELYGRFDPFEWLGAAPPAQDPFFVVYVQLPDTVTIAFFSILVLDSPTLDKLDKCI